MESGDVILPSPLCPVDQFACDAEVKEGGQDQRVPMFPANLGLSFDCMKLCFSLDSLDSLGKGCRLRYVL